MLVTTLKYLMNAPDVIHLINMDLIRATRLDFFPKSDERTGTFIRYLRVCFLPSM